VDDSASTLYRWTPWYNTQSASDGEEEEEIYLAQTKLQLIDNIIQLTQVARKPYWSTMLAN